MKNLRRTQFHTRAGIMKLLSDQEAAGVSIAETAPQLGDGEEYIDLRHLARGVQRAAGAMAPMSGVLPRGSVRGATWAKILEQLTALQRATLAERPSREQARR